MLRNCLIGERATWPKLTRIRDRLAIELALDQAVHALRARVVFSKSQVDLRRALGARKPMAYKSAPDNNNNSKGGFVVGADSTDVTPSPSSSGVVRIVQPPLPPSSGEVTPLEERGLGRRRGSGASIQLVAARHKKPFFQDAGEDEFSDEEEEGEEEGEERLELKFHSSRAARGGVRAGGGGGLMAPPPRLRRNAKSHGHMRSGKPAGDFRGGEREELFRPAAAAAAAVGGFPWSRESTGESWVEVGAEAEAEAGGVDTAAAVAAAGAWEGEEEGEDDGANSPSVEAFNVSIPLTPSATETEGTAQASDGGLASDADPYAGGHGARAPSPKNDSPSKLRYSVS
jgi:TAG lipase/steryl ester hydrolase/phospholipase A2/LPA acyltransferase